jgi:hypothetical protein
MSGFNISLGSLQVEILEDESTIADELVKLTSEEEKKEEEAIPSDET